MKTIEVTDEMYNSLMELSKEMTSQDNLGTRMPHMFQIRTKKEVAAHEGCGEEIWVNDEGDELRTVEEIAEYVEQYLSDNDNQEQFKEMDSDEILGFLQDELNEGWRKVWVNIEYEYKNTFLTSKACQEHIDANHYHYNEPIVYLNHAWRNPEQEIVSKFLCELSGGKLHT